MDQWEIDLRQWRDARTSGRAHIELGALNPVAAAMIRDFEDSDAAEACVIQGLAPDALEEATRRRLLSARSASIIADLSDLRSKAPPEKLREAVSIPLLILTELENIDPGGQIRDQLEPVVGRPRGSKPPVQSLRTDAPAVTISTIETLIQPLASRSGLWLEKNLADDLTFLLSSQDLARRVLTFVASYEPPADLVECLKEQLLDLTPVWEWRHLASVARGLQRFEHDYWKDQVEVLGFFTVIADSRDEAYRHLARIHTLRSDPARFRDYYSNPGPSGYAALHTTVFVNRTRVAVRLTDQPRSHRYARATKDWTRVWNERLRASRDPLAVRTPNGRVVTLPAGATVLNFCYKLNKGWITRIRGAIINGRKEPVDILAPLTDGDVVKLILKHPPEPLPEHWDTKVPEATVSGIASAQKRSLNEPLRNRGRRALRRRLEELGMLGLPESQVDSFLADALESDKNRLRVGKGWSASDWLKQIGLLEAHTEDLRGYAHHLAIDTRDVDAVARAIWRQRFDLPHIDLDPKLRVGLKTTRWCDRCKPGAEAATLAAERHKGTLTLHRSGSDCARTPGIVEITKRQPWALLKYVTLDVNNRPGILLEVMRLFRYHEIDIVEVFGKRLAPSWGVIRFELDCPDSSKLKRLLEELRKLPGIVRLWRPEDPEDEFLLTVLPPRREPGKPPVSYRYPPYHVHSEIQDDVYFYGRDEELELLQRELSLTTRTGAPSGSNVLVTGPLKFGKTSLLLQHLRRLEVRPSCSVYAHTAFRPATDRTWSTFSERIRERLSLAADIAARKWLFTPREDLRSCGLRALIDDVLSWSKDACVVLALDEVGFLLDALVRGPADEARALEEFVAYTQQRPGLQVLWSVPAHHLLAHQDVHLVLDVLTRFPRATLKPLTPDNVSALLASRKTRGYRIVPGASKSVFELTNGDPYWVPIIGKLWYDEFSKGQWEQRLLDEHVLWAKNKLLAQQSELQLRIERACPPGPQFHSHRTAMAEILETLSRASSLDVSSLWSGAEDQPHPAKRYMLDMLEAAGVVRLEIKDATVLCHVASPLMAEYLRIGPWRVWLQRALARDVHIAELDPETDQNRAALQGPTATEPST